MLKHNFDVKKLPDYVSIPPFYLEMLKLWSEINCFEPVQVADICTQGIWNHKFILVGNNSLYYSKFDEAALHTIYDFFDDNNTIKSIANYDRFNTIDLLKWYSLLHAIPKKK